MDYDFWEVFDGNENQLTPKKVVSINGVTMGTGVTFSRGVSFGGIDIFKFYGKRLRGEETNGVLEINGYYE